VQDSIVEKFKPEDVVVFGLTRDETTYQWLVDYVAQQGISFDMLYYADEVFEMYGAYSVPTYVLIDKQGQIRLRESAYYSYRMQDLIILIQKLIEGF
jgi:peroxiredoxin